MNAAEELRLNHELYHNYRDFTGQEYQLRADYEPSGPHYYLETYIVNDNGQELYRSHPAPHSIADLAYRFERHRSRLIAAHASHN